MSSQAVSLTLSTIDLVVYCAVILIAAHNSIQYILKQKRYRDKRTGYKLVIFYALGFTLSFIRIALGILFSSPFSQLVLYELLITDAMVRFAMWTNYMLQTDDLRRVLRVMTLDNCELFNDALLQEQLRRSKRSTALEVVVYVGVVMLSVAPFFLRLKVQFYYAGVLSIIQTIVITTVTGQTLLCMKKLAAKDGQSLRKAFSAEVKNLTIPLVLILVFYTSFIGNGFYVLYLGDEQVFIYVSFLLTILDSGPILYIMCMHIYNFGYNREL